MRRSLTSMLALSLAALAALALGSGCDKINELTGRGEPPPPPEEAAAEPAATAEPAAAQPAEAAAQPAQPAEAVAQPAEAVAQPTEGAAQPADDEKARYIKAAADAACLSAMDPSKAVEATTLAITAKGFDQLSYAKATAKYAQDATVLQAIEAEKAKCMAAAPKPKTEEGAEEAEAEEGNEEAKTEEGAEEAKTEEAKEDEKPKLSPLAGKWMGSILGEKTGKMSFTVDKTGRKATLGNVTSTGADRFGLGFKGDIRGKSVILNGRLPRNTNKMLMRGSVNLKHRKMTGSWTGTINGRPARGTWNAKRVKR